MERIVIFGATGDLAARYLMPALAKLYEADKLPPGIKITGVDRQEWDDEHGFRRLVLDNLEHHAGNVSADARATMAVEVLEYRQADVTDAESVISALEPLTEPMLAYLALPPAVFAPTLEALKEANLPEGSRVAVEKPFGVNLESAQELNRLLHGFLPEGAIFRIDHFLAWQPFPTIMGLRFANGIFEPLWDRNYIERVEIIWEEPLALEGRAGYFDHAGAFKDLIQNHLIQLLCLTAMEAPPPSIGATCVTARLTSCAPSGVSPPRRRNARPCAPATGRARSGRGISQPTPMRRGWTPPGGPRPSPRSRSRSTTCVGLGCRSCCAAARPSAVFGPRSPCTSKRCPTSPSSGRATPSLMCCASGWARTGSR